MKKCLCPGPGEPARHLVAADGLEEGEEGALARPLGAVGRVVRPRLLYLIAVALVLWRILR